MRYLSVLYKYYNILSVSITSIYLYQYIGLVYQCTSIYQYWHIVQVYTCIYYQCTSLLVYSTSIYYQCTSICLYKFSEVVQHLTLSWKEVKATCHRRSRLPAIGARWDYSLGLNIKVHLQSRFEDNCFNHHLTPKIEPKKASQHL